MRFRGVHHIELTVPDYEASLAFYDRLFGWLGYKSFWTLDIEYRSTYYTAGWLPHFPHSYIGIQPVKEEPDADVSAPAAPLKGHRYRPGLNHLALAARGKREVRRFHDEFLVPGGIEVVEPPAAYPHYAPGYFAVFFRDPPLGAVWELACLPLIPSPRDFWASWQAWKRIRADRQADHPEGAPLRLRDALRPLPGRNRAAEDK